MINLAIMRNKNNRKDPNTTGKIETGDRISNQGREETKIETGKIQTDFQKEKGRRST